jgi:hypothetical protein
MVPVPHHYDHLDRDGPALFHVLSDLHLVHPSSVHVLPEDKLLVVGRRVVAVVGVGMKTPESPL